MGKESQTMYNPFLVGQSSKFYKISLPLAEISLLGGKGSKAA